MAFVLEDLRSVLSLSPMPSVAQAGIRERRHTQMWHYTTSDSLNAVMEINYFLRAGANADGSTTPGNVSGSRLGLLRVGDIILVSTDVDLSTLPSDAVDLNLNAALLTVTATRGICRVSLFTAASNMAWNTAIVGTDAAATEKALFSYTLPRYFVSVPGQGVRIRALLKGSAGTGAKTVNFKVDGVTMLTSAASAANEVIELQAEIIRDTVTSGHMYGRIHRSATPGAYTYLATTFSWEPATSAIWTINGQSAAGVANDLVLHSAQVSHFGN